ncbi:signal peptidase II [Rhizomonospora bruguierae]|uniref:signal peptidase II n=1 Tax=Rhizomonospora bruguierae TaxID=1581705 RepID=UPI0020BF992F|nr:signal peptidase II [Micromonospora sp. NBRC 107566]
MHDPQPDETDRTRRWRSVTALALAALAVVALDAWTKNLALAHLTPGESPRILGGLVYLSLIRNSGIAFGLASGATVLIATIALGAILVIIRVAPRLRSPLWAVVLGLLLGGALGNLLDRAFRGPGFLDGRVVDFISVFGPNAVHFPAFNIADSAITVGAVGLVLLSLFDIGLDGRRRTRPEPPPTPARQEPDRESDRDTAG